MKDVTDVVGFTKPLHLYSNLPTKKTHTLSYSQEVTTLMMKPWTKKGQIKLKKYTRKKWNNTNRKNGKNNIKIKGQITYDTRKYVLTWNLMKYERTTKCEQRIEYSCNNKKMKGIKIKSIQYIQLKIGKVK